MYLAEFINVCGHQQRIKMMNREPLFLPDCSKASSSSNLEKCQVPKVATSCRLVGGITF